MSPPRPAAPPAAPVERSTSFLPNDYLRSEPGGLRSEPGGHAAEQPDEQDDAAPSRWPWILAAVALVGLLGLLVFAVWPRNEEPASTSAPATSTSRVATTTRLTSTPTTTTSSAPVTFDAMRTLVTGFYGELPANARTAWNSLDVHYQQRNGLDDYLSFWSTIESVTVLSVSPRDANSVVATLRYVLRDGRIDTENRWLSVVPVNGQLLIYDSERIGPA